MPDTMRAGLLFLINTVFNLYLFILIIRVILAFVHAEYFHPFTQFMLKCTNFIVKPLRKYIPNVYGIEIATLILILVLIFIKFFLIAVISVGLPHILGLLVLTIGEFINLLIETFFYAILFQAILSWIQPASPINYILYQFTSPLMKPIRRVVPPVSGFDISAIPALILLKLLSIILVTQMMDAGWRIALG